MTESGAGFGSYDWFVSQAEELLRPIASLLRQGESTIPIEGPPSDHGEMADLLESVARPMLLAALWLRADRRGSALDAERVAGWFRGAIEHGTDAASAKYWGNLSNHHQHAVEMAILAMAIDLAKPYLWEPLPDEAKTNAAAWFGQIRGHAGYRNNHLFFDVLVLEFLRTIGHARDGDKAAIDFLMRQLESMHMGDGWFIDGTNETYDHYNAYAFHVYGLYWAWRHGETNPGRADRWKGWAARFVEDYAHCFAATGEPVPIGRSLTYRFNGLGVFSLAQLNGIGTVPAGQARAICARCLDFFTSRPIGQSQGCLSIGWVDRFDEMREPYSCAGSPYWASKGFMMLALGRDHPFFAEPLGAPPAEVGFTRALVTPGWVVRSLGGREVEVVNVGGVCSPGAAARMGSSKWGRLAYRTGTGWLASKDPENPPPDVSLRARAHRGGPAYERISTIPIRCDADGARTWYALGSKVTGVHVRVDARVHWRDEWLLCLFEAEAYEPATLWFGGFALADDTPLETAVHHGVEESASHQTGDGARGPHALVHSGDSRSVIQPVLGFDRVNTVARGADEPRAHLYGPHHAVPVCERTEASGLTQLAVVIGAGVGHAPGELWSVEAASGSRIELAHPRLGSWVIENPFG